MITAIICSALPVVENGMITYSSDTTEPYDYETTATYQCDSGYELTGGDTVRTCTDDGSSPVGRWNGTAPICSGITRTRSIIPCSVLYLIHVVLYAYNEFFSSFILSKSHHSCLLWLSFDNRQWIS